MKQKSILIMGKNCILEVLSADPKRILEVYTLSTMTDDPLYQRLIQTGIPIRQRSKHELFRLAQSASHQNFVASVRERNNMNLRSFFNAIPDICLCVMLDSIFDPHNFGAILRAAECFGVNGIVYSKNRGTQITPVVSKVSSGASELIPVVRVSNLAQTAKAFREEGFSVIAADVGEKAVSLYDVVFPKKTLLIFGSEGEGVQTLLKKNSDLIVRIPMQGSIDSLNVSQAAAVFLHSFRKTYPNT